MTLIATVLGLAASAGVNLYLTTLVAGVSVRMGWLAGFPPELSILGTDWLLGVAGTLCVIEFFADKVPWIDSIWDTIHTVVRPLGGVALALQTVGTTEPWFDVLAALAAGGVTLSTHSTKASTRLVANHSPEPFSNIALSVVEDVGVLGFTWFTLKHPVLAALLVGSFLIAFAFVAPKIFRLSRAQVTFVLGRIRSWFDRRARHLFAPHDQVLGALHPRHSARLLALLAPGERPLFAVPCFSGRMRRVGRSVPGVVVGTDSNRLFFIGRRTLRTVSRCIELRGHRTELRRRLLVDEICVYTQGDGLVVLRFDKSRADLARQISLFIERSGAVEMRSASLVGAPPACQPL